ncbi:MAG: hypothetical protein GY794_06685 [bacterium]|nr:hypothetical protein [bacterium]
MLHRHSDYGPTHWDLMLEVDDALATWQIESDPLAMLPAEPITATRIHDHRKAYLDYSGQVSGGRGRVAVADSGQLTVASEDDNLWTFELRGSILQGRFELRAVSGNDNRWTLRSG